MRRVVVLTAAALALPGCGGTKATSPAERDAEAARKSRQAISALKSQTLKTALAEVVVERAELAHARAVKHLHAVERAIEEGKPPPSKKLPGAEERAYLRKDRHYAALERWIRAGAHGECRC